MSEKKYYRCPEPNPLKLQFSIGFDPPILPSPYISVAEDIDWLRDDWLSLSGPPDPAMLRRGSAVLRRLLVDGLVHEAWKFHAMKESPTVFAPDLLEVLRLTGTEPRHVVVAVAGGGVQQGRMLVAPRACRTTNPETGVSADADEGFAVVTGVIARAVTGQSEPNELQAASESVWRIPQYLGGAGAIRRGNVITRRSVIQYFANHAGGVHLDRVKSAPKKVEYALLEELERSSSAFDLNGVYFELFSIGQAVGGSDPLNSLSDAIRKYSVTHT